MTVEGRHLPVLLEETVAFLQPRPGGCYLDATVGLGGHAETLLIESAPTGCLCGIDRDVEALALAKGRLGQFGSRVELRYGDFASLGAIAAENEWRPFDGILFDLGFSSFQMDNASRGFSFMRDGLLDMRMDRQGCDKSAAELLARIPERELARLLQDYGEERWAKRIAARIVEARRTQPLTSTAQLARLVAAAVPRRAWPRRIHVATRTFQALRIAVNDELARLRRGLQNAVELLAVGGRICVISFHSLEDRIVKEVFRGWARSEPPRVRLLTKRPVVPTERESEINPRARSAKLRAAERC
ncbi:MAG: 16S rRNA (cytosine(1402)-N(4))-methyltransferase RsmH [Candidatus Methylomirabilis oxygeniifera]|uniref:Ribosomal RNA small subunit methyltransferase H n=1 Tax=Methylomirabilis oxygeniifera TaxID=671143 RepID=D5MI64_METO1|nr:MAG: 16S rRNA (cytosine(1402)-N(4))-methyltransferase RsmH [Candidatus Methylomirabilis oxyfera]CBE69357.1 S-adenosyl-dependent methyl transferase [Candidatus Methylomirabilis oxyfera]